MSSRPTISTSIGSLRYVSLGDSSGVGIGAGGDGGYPARLARRLRALGVDVKHTNEAESGATSDDVVRSQLGWTQRLGTTIANGVDVVTLERRLRSLGGAHVARARAPRTVKGRQGRVAR